MHDARGGHDAPRLERLERPKVLWPEFRDHVGLPRRKQQATAAVRRPFLDERGRKCDQAVLVIARFRHHERTARAFVHRHDFIGSDGDRVEGGSGPHLPHQCIGEARDAATAVDKPGRLDHVSRSEWRGSSGLHPHTTGGDLQVNIPSCHGVNHRPPDPHHVAARRLAAIPGQ